MNFTGRHFLKLLDYTPEEIEALLTLAAYYGVPPRELYKGVYFPTLFS